ncbi:MAG: ABC transporter permease [Anaerolineae bacterium]|jgi:peptide/nickel transport system permease protein|nr:ABC transporter permease [Anaerolineae bacterium]
MFKYILRRALQAIPLLFFISFALFGLMQASGDPLATFGGRQPLQPDDRARLARQMGLDQPFLVQYLIWLTGDDWLRWDTDGDRLADHAIIVPLADLEGQPLPPGRRYGIIRGDFGASVQMRKPAIEVIGDKIGPTLLLMGTAQVVIVIVSLVIGILSAVRQYTWVDSLLTSFSFVMYSFPIFLIALLLMYLFAIKFREWGLPYFPISGMFDPRGGVTPQEIAWHMVLPVTSISLISIAGYSRYIRSTMLEVINSDYIRTARAKGLSERRTLMVHAFKNASLPLVTLIGLDIPFLLGGAVVTEQLFGWPGLGSQFINSINASDFPVLMTLLMMISVAVVIFQILTDITYTFLDPRIRY